MWLLSRNSKLVYVHSRRTCPSLSAMVTQVTRHSAWNTQDLPPAWRHGCTMEAYGTDRLQPDGRQHRFDLVVEMEMERLEAASLLECMSEQVTADRGAHTCHSTDCAI